MNNLKKIRSHLFHQKVIIFHLFILSILKTMFDTLSERFQRVIKNIAGLGQITENNIKSTLQEVRTAMLEADVALPVIEQLNQVLLQKSLGQTVLQGINPGQAFIKIVHDELITLMGATANTLNLNAPPPAVILLAGPQGSGKTTSAAKLSRFIKQNTQKSILLFNNYIKRVTPLKPYL